MLVLLVAVFALLVWLELPGLIRSKSWKELAVYSVLMLLAISVSIMYVLDFDLPNPVKNTQYYVKAAFEYLFNLSYD